MGLFFIFKQKAAYEIGLGITAEPLYRSVHQQTQNQRYGSSHIGATARDISDFFFQAEDGIRDDLVTGVQTCALPISFPYSRHEIDTTDFTAPRRPPSGRGIGRRQEATTKGSSRSAATPTRKGQSWWKQDRKSVV